jgi:hypothetical protein
MKGQNAAEIAPSISGTLSNPAEINFTALCGADLVTLPSKICGNETIGVPRVAPQSAARPPAIRVGPTSRPWFVLALARIQRLVVQMKAFAKNNLTPP